MRVGGGPVPGLPFAPGDRRCSRVPFQGRSNRGPEGIVNSRSSIRAARTASLREPGRLGQGCAVHVGGQPVE
jgi:hypothetical protein